MKNTKVTLVPLTEDNREQFILDNQWSFKYGALQEFGKRDNHIDDDGEIISRKTIERCIDAPDSETYRIVLDGRKTMPCDVFIAERKADRTVLIFIIQEGRNRQIRRMCEAVGLKVLRLKRTEIAGVKLGMLPQGKWRPLNEKEMRHLTNVTTKKEEI